MWPKAFSQLVELAPHITRLLPLADRYFKDKSSSDEATRKALDELQANHRATLEAHRATVTDLADRLHADLGGVASQLTTQNTQTTALQRQLGELEKQLGGITRPVAELEKHLVSTRADALAAKQATESVESRLAAIEAAGRRVQTLSIIAVLLLVAILVLIATLFLRAR